MSSVLITGATGLLGRKVVQAFERSGWNAIGAGYNRAKAPNIIKLDLCSEVSVLQALLSIRPKVVVHCAAYRFPEKCDGDHEGTQLLNVTATDNLASICAARNIFLIYISTDYVFSGIQGEAPYDADSTRKPTNFYGETKSKGEDSVLRAYQRADGTGWGIVLRVPVLYGEVEYNKESAVNVLVDSIWKAQEDGVIIPMDHWAIRYPTNTEDVARVVEEIAMKIISTPNKSKLPTKVQFTSEDHFTKYEICQLLARILDLPINNLKADFPDRDTCGGIQRPYDCHLSTKGLLDLGVDVSTVDFEEWWRCHLSALKR
ncbi:BgTH12-07415 [Blumeria graminis f. sp. triticale]|uniref:BgTH12-07415 n=3 Tax=Blumeria graminis TaxID=34373 RepID=A0A9W4CXL3_BLUGR|nr:BgTH12-07415 [Blumeria graminis f. sp. triticale]